MFRGHVHGFRCTRHVSLQRSFETASPSLRGVLRSSSPASTLLWDAPTPCRPSRRTSLPSFGDTIVSSPVRPHQLGTVAVDQPGVGKPGLQAGSHDGDGRVSQVPERPSCPCALFLDPGRTEVRQAIAAPRHGPRLCQQRWLPRAEDFGARSHGIGTRCLRFAMEVARHHARLASGCWPSFAGRDSLTRGVAMKGFRVQSLPPFSSLPDAMTPDFPRKLIHRVYRRCASPMARRRLSADCGTTIR